MPRIALGVRYDGSAYHGWQVQDRVSTIQQQVERALSVVADQPIMVVCAGRTDAGVHASGQVLHFDTMAYRSNHAWIFGVNNNLPYDISITWAKEVDESFHARYGAFTRRYRYVIYNHEIRPAILHKAIGWYFRPLDEKRMQAAAQFLLGEHDFSSFQGAGCQSKTPMRTIFQIEIFRIRRMVVIEVQANAFLLHMMRNIVGVLVAIGSGKKEPKWADGVLRARDRQQRRGVTVSLNGLYLVEVTYSTEFKLPRTPLGPFFLL